MGEHYYYTHFTDKEIKAQRGHMDSSWLGFKPKQSDSRGKTLIALLIPTISILIFSNANSKMGPFLLTLDFSI